MICLLQKNAEFYHILVENIYLYKADHYCREKLLVLARKLSEIKFISFIFQLSQFLDFIISLNNSNAQLIMDIRHPEHLYLGISLD